MPTPSDPETSTSTEWISFDDEHGVSWMFDLTFLVSPWSCIFGRGCPGIGDGPAPELEQGCCSHGAHLADDDDGRAVLAQAARLDATQWQHLDTATARGGPLKRSGAHTMTRTVDGACIFLNRPGFAGGAGCALHLGAVAAGERPMDWKPDVCWQLPLRLESHTDDHDHTTWILRAWLRRDWGEGGASFHWWCTEDHGAFGADRAAFRSLRDEIVELVGEDPYGRLVDHLERERREVPLPHPARRRAGGR